MPQDLYDLLGVERDADIDAIKQAYRARARELHPDVCPDRDADARFSDLSEAYAVLSRAESRRLYDRFGWRGRGRGFDRRPPFAYHTDKRGLLQDLESLIVSVAGGRPKHEPTRVVANLEVDAYEAHTGATRRVEVAEERGCETCEGSGRRKISSEHDAVRLLYFELCAVCKGTGMTEGTRTIEIPVPPRARDLDRVPVGPDEVAIVNVVAPREPAAVRAAALLGLLAAVGFLLFLLAL